MIKRRILILLTVSGSFCAQALNELGTLSQARKAHEAVFVPGNVLTYEIAGTWGYVFNGEAENLFSGKMSEKDSDLYREALLDAKKNLLIWLKKRYPGKGFSFGECVKLYEYPEGNMRRVVCFIKRTNVSKRELSEEVLDGSQEDSRVQPSSRSAEIDRLLNEDRKPVLNGAGGAASGNPLARPSAK